MHANVHKQFLHRDAWLTQGSWYAAGIWDLRVSDFSVELHHSRPWLEKDAAHATGKCIGTLSMYCWAQHIPTNKQAAEHSAPQHLCPHLNMDKCGADLLQLRMKSITRPGPPVCTKWAAHAPLSWTQCASSATAAMACK